MSSGWLVNLVEGVLLSGGRVGRSSVGTATGVEMVGVTVPIGSSSLVLLYYTKLVSVAGPTVTFCCASTPTLRQHQCP
jgi:hypothetical protein